MYSQTKDESFYNEELNLLTNTLKKEPFDKNMYKQLMTLYQSNSENDKAYAVLRDNADRYAYDMNWYEQLIVQSYELGYQALGQQDTAKKDDYFKTGLAAYQHVVAGVEHLKTLPKGQLQGNPFEITQPMVLNAGKMQYMLNDPAKAAEIFKVGIKDDLNDGTNREIARWYLAALQKNGTTDQAVYDRLLQMDPNEKGEIDKITQQNF